MKYLIIIIVLGLVVMSCSKSDNSSKNISKKTSISALDIKNKLDNKESLNIIDVRSESEYFGSVGHIQNATLVPLPSIASALDALKNLEGEVYIICLSGKRSAVAAKLLRANSINALNIEGGMLAWNNLIK